MRGIVTNSKLGFVNRFMIAICVIIILIFSIGYSGVDLTSNGNTNEVYEVSKPQQQYAQPPNIRHRSLHAHRWWITYLDEYTYTRSFLTTTYKPLPHGFVPSEKPKRIFLCGTGQPGEEKWMQYTGGALAVKEIFSTRDPHFLVHNFSEAVIEHGATSEDILISHLWGKNYACHFRPDAFPGKTMLFSGEPFYTHLPGERLYHFGCNPNDVNSIWVPFVVLCWIRLQPHQQVKIVNHRHKPVNTQEHFLMYAASNCLHHRDEAFDAIAKVMKNSNLEIHHGGKCRGHHARNILKERLVDVSTIMDRNSGAFNNFVLYNKYRFAMVMENSNIDGYISEKILNAFLGGSVPIYAGSPYIFNIFNHKSFVYYDLKNPVIALKQIAYLEGNQTAYNEMLAEPILADGENTLKRYFSFSDNVGGGLLKQRIRSMMGYEDPNIHLKQLQIPAVY